MSDYFPNNPFIPTSKPVSMAGGHIIDARVKMILEKKNIDPKMYAMNGKPSPLLLNYIDGWKAEAQAMYRHRDYTGLTLRLLEATFWSSIVSWSFAQENMEAFMALAASKDGDKPDADMDKVRTSVGVYCAMLMSISDEYDPSIHDVLLRHIVMERLDIEETMDLCSRICRYIAQKSPEAKALASAMRGRVHNETFLNESFPPINQTKQDVFSKLDERYQRGLQNPDSPYPAPGIIMNVLHFYMLAVNSGFMQVDALTKTLEWMKTQGSLGPQLVDVIEEEFDMRTTLALVHQKEDD